MRPADLRLMISREDAGQRVDTLLRRHFGCSSRLLKALKGLPEGLMLNGGHIRTIDRVSQGDCLEVRLPRREESRVPASAAAVRLLYEDDQVLVLQKPAGMPTHPVKRHQLDTLANAFAALMEARGQQMPFRPVNRLDKDTTGCVLAAKNAFAACRLARQVEKEYLAVAHGLLARPGRIEAPIGREGEDTPRRQVRADGKYACTEYAPMKVSNNYTFLRIKLHTGRTHQIRVHLAWLGHPLAGDALYGGSGEIISRQALHCWRLKFCHPVTGRIIRVCAPLQQDMQNLWDHWPPNGQNE